MARERHEIHENLPAFQDLSGTRCCFAFLIPLRDAFAEKEVSLINTQRNRNLMTLTFSLFVKNLNLEYQVFMKNLSKISQDGVSVNQVQWGWGITGQRTTGQSCPDWLKMTSSRILRLNVTKT